MYLKNNRSVDVGVKMDHRTDQVMSQPTQLTSEVDKRKAEIVELFHAHLNSATTIEHCKVIENALLPIGPTFLAMQSNSIPLKFPASTRIPGSKRNIEPQERKLFSTKKSK